MENQSFKIWESDQDSQDILKLLIPFKIKLSKNNYNINLPPNFSTELGSVNYILRATVNRKVLPFLKQPLSPSSSLEYRNALNNSDDNNLPINYNSNAAISNYSMAF